MTSRMSEPLVIIHERLGRWAGQLRPRFQKSSVRWAETRSTASLVRASSKVPCPILVLDLDGRLLNGLEDLDAFTETAPAALSVVLSPTGQPELAALARELGATIVLGGVVVPPVVESLIRRWLPISVQKTVHEGWSPDVEIEPEPWDHTKFFDIALPPQIQ